MKPADEAKTFKDLMARLVLGPIGQKRLFSS